MNIRTLKYGLLKLLTALFLLPMATACGLVTDDIDSGGSQQNAKRYINLILYVNSDATGTRAPLGGENGDYREAGYLRENQVNGITLILYKSGESGIDDPDAKVDFIHYFTVTEEDNLEGRDTQGTTYNYDAAQTYYSEARYTTGDQPVAEDELDFDGRYHVLIVANQNIISDNCKKGTLISDVLKLKINNVYSVTDANKAKPDQYQEFVMTSERDAVIDFGAMAPVQKDGVQNGLVYRVMKPLLIERMSARIDYCTKGSSYDETLGGYKYKMGETDAEGFYIVTKVTPFNLYNEDEYLFKRVRNNWTDAEPVITYLGDESTANYVVDPMTANKDNGTASQPTYLSPLAQKMSTVYAQSMNNLSANQKFTDANGHNVIVIAYPKENTLMPTSYLKQYATGIAFEAKYYANASAAPQTFVYYHYLRHQGELSSGSYQAKKWGELSNTEISSASVPMNYGIVRNNIYRVEITGFNTVEGTIKIKIEEKKWRHVDNPTIYI